MKNMFKHQNKCMLLLVLLAVNVLQISASNRNQFSLRSALLGSAFGFFVLWGVVHEPNPNVEQTNCCDVPDGLGAQALCFYLKEYPEYNPTGDFLPLKQKGLFAAQKAFCCNGKKLKVDDQGIHQITDDPDCRKIWGI